MTTRTFASRYHWVAPGLVTGLLLLSGVAAATGVQKFPATGQTTSYRSGDDGDIQAGTTLRYRDNGNGTIRDRNTRLVWEKKSDDEDPNDGDNATLPHDKDNTYTWDEAFDVHVATLNTICANDETVTCSVNADCVAAGVGGKCGFAGKRDWRVPNVKELQSIVNYQNINPSVSSAFNNSCDSGDTVTDGSCTGVDAVDAVDVYWSSSSFAGNPAVGGWGVNFQFGGVGLNSKDDFLHVRAVRGGSP